MAISFRIALREVMRAKGITNETLAERMGVHPVTVSKLLTGRMQMTEKRMREFAEALDMDVARIGAYLDAPEPAAKTGAAMIRTDLPVYGLAAGSITGAMTISEEPFEYVACPPGLARVKDAYALVVSGASMEPKFVTGDLIFVHPPRPVRPGDHVVIQEARDRHVITSVKRFEKKTEKHLITTQYNPLAEVRFALSTVTAVHRVMTVNELFGL